MHLKRTVAVGLSLAGTAAAGVLKPRSTLKCNADNCLRAIRASHIPTRLAQASIDCSQFLAGIIGGGGGEQHATYTITESATITSVSTITLPTTTTDDFHTTQTATAGLETIIVTVPLPGGQTAKKRQAIITIPAYASLCSGPVRFTSACACIGVASVPPAETCSHTETVSTTITIPATETVYTTATETTTLATTTTATPQEIVTSVYRYRIRTFDGTTAAYLKALQGPVYLVEDIAEATYFTSGTGLGSVYSADDLALALQAFGNGSNLAYVQMDDTDLSFQYFPIQCEVNPGGNKLDCQHGISNVFGRIGQNLIFGPSDIQVDALLELTAVA
ncbi:hypothetical protein TWF225_006958 [Orbilia oligospora]|nr:hypothetical protein TWF225_006958 [Orbilia oligospora]KAF3242720.1 hypothetical protein TWF128_010454 [Orbilia oligospora]KAF3264166.1 hypothetical protein TWF217_003318 [Orbilia oligospora]KAF3296082.1 hypothetical protein TWF132_011551 [Orbilia oligospora]